MINLVQLFPYLIGFDPTNPTDNSIVSQFPSNERDSRSALVSAWAIEHDNVDGRHSFGIGNTAARDAITTWTSGAIFINTSAGAGNTVLQTVVSVTASVPGWEDTGRFTSADDAKLVTIASAAQANVSIATSAEAVAGTDNVNTMTSLRTKTAIDATVDAIVDTNVEVITASKTWTQPSGVTKVTVLVVGSGGGGAGANNGARNGGGGGGGEYVRAGVTVSGDITVTINSGGAGGASGVGGTNGGTSVFDDIVANGGDGAGTPATPNGPGGVGGTGGSDGAGNSIMMRAAGSTGEAGPSGGGGDGGMSGETKLSREVNGATSTGTNGDDATTLGTGGGGAEGLVSTTTGGAGSDGFVIVWW